ncbi:MAG TPA: MobF family relaxase [Solirubrobacterales bacterium]|jgi:conjugative relaxase-like TrwC/TraI family protein|nr:MobF family relaxase [Solirubrobacterales bacterium]
MVSIGKMGSGQEHYYLGKVAEGAEDYYSGKGEAEGYWLGDGAAELGLDGTVEPDQLVAMLTGRDPATGEPLGLRHVAGKGPVPGFDLTFSVPKSVSLLWALGGPEVGAQIEAAHAASIEAAFGYLQREACWTRRGAGGHEFVPGNGFLAAGYLHRSSRAGDPHLHTHTLIANATKGPDGRWTRLYHPALYNHAKTAGYLAEAHLRHELSQRLGIEWTEPENGIAQIKGFDPEHMRAFSTRHQQVLEAAGPDASAKARQIANLATKPAKDHALTDADMREGWWRKAAEIGITPELLRSTLGHEREAQRQTLAIDQLGEALTAHASHFDRRDAIQAVADSLQAGAPAHEVEAVAGAFLQSPSIMRVGESPKGARYTTERIWELERQALDSAEAMGGNEGRAVAHEIVIARTLDSRPSMKPDQVAMVRRLLGGGEGLVVVVGEAGAGKTYAVQAAAVGWAAAGIEVRAAAPTWRAANGLRSEGLEATSVAKLLGELDGAAERGRVALPAGSVLLVDEAGMVDSAALARLIDHARRAEAKLVLVGDPAQLGEIEAGGLFAAVADRSDPVVLDEVIRHSHELDREGAKRIREGRGAEALEIYRSEGRVIVAADPEARREEMVRDWWRSFGAGEDSLMLAKRNAEVDRLNALAREVMKAEGRLGAEEIEVGGQMFAAGDQVITRINDQRQQMYNRERWQVADVDARAQTVTLDGIDTQKRVCVDSVFLGRVNEQNGAAALQHAYAATIYQAQGATVERAYVMVDPSMDRQEFYVAASRSHEETFFYATPEVQIDREEIAPASPHMRHGIEHIAEAAEREGAQVAAHDQALRSELGKLSTEELYRRRRELRSEAGAERESEQYREQLEERIAEGEQRLDHLAERAERVGDLPRRERKPEIARIETDERLNEQAIERWRAERDGLPEVGHQARAESAVIDHVIAERERAAFLAARTSPSDYIVRELGERPTDPAKRQTWDRAVRGIEGYRQQHGIRDRDNLLGAEPESHAGRAARQAQERRLRQSQRELGRKVTATRTQSLSKGMGIGR